jgi:hypothetical protein
VAIAVHLLPDLVGAVDLKVGMPELLDLRHRFGISQRSLAQQGRIPGARCMSTVGRRGNLQDFADRLDPVDGAVPVDE